MASALLLVAISPSSALAAGMPASRNKLFVFVQGLNSFLTSARAVAQGGDGTDPGFFKNGHL